MNILYRFLKYRNNLIGYVEGRKTSRGMVYIVLVLVLVLAIACMMLVLGMMVFHEAS